MWKRQEKLAEGWTGVRVTNPLGLPELRACSAKTQSPRQTGMTDLRN